MQSNCVDSCTCIIRKTAEHNHDDAHENVDVGKSLKTILLCLGLARISEIEGIIKNNYAYLQ